MSRSEPRIRASGRWTGGASIGRSFSQCELNLGFPHGVRLASCSRPGSLPTPHVTTGQQL